MATGQDSAQNALDINEVLESLGQIIGELDACAREVGNNGHSTSEQEADLRLEALLADTDEFGDDEKLRLISKPLQSLQPVFSGSNHYGLQHEDCMKSSEHKGAAVPTIPPSHKKVTRNAKRLTQNTLSSQNQQQNVYSIPQSQCSHKGAVNKVALTGEVCGTFKKVTDSPAATPAPKSPSPPTHASGLYRKVQPNYYVARSELRQCTFNSHAGNVASPKEQAYTMTIKVYSEDNSPVELNITQNTTSWEACHKLVLLNKAEDDPQWVLVEHLTDLKLERNMEDHEIVMSTYITWAPGSNNKFLFRKDFTKYHFFTHTSNYFPPHLLDSEGSDKAVTQQAQKAKRILQQKLFSTCTRVPEVEGYLHFKDFGKKSWNKKFFFLRGSGLYCSTRGKSKASKDLECYVQFDGANIYSMLNPNKSHRSPTEFNFCLVPSKATDFKELKCLCADDEKAVTSWRMAVRLAKYGPQLRQNYDDMLRKFAKLTKYHSTQEVIAEREGKTIEIVLKEGQVAMDFTGDQGKIITDSREIQELAVTRQKVKVTRRVSSQNFIPTHTTVPGCQFKHESWYHGRITRERSLELLMDAGVVDGLFLIRESSSVLGVFVLSFCMNRKVYHCQLVQDVGHGNQTFFSLGKGQAFRTLQELVHFYQKKPLNGVSLALRTPCSKQERPLAFSRSREPHLES